MDVNVSLKCITLDVPKSGQIGAKPVIVRTSFVFDMAAVQAMKSAYLGPEIFSIPLVPDKTGTVIPGSSSYDKFRITLQSAAESPHAKIEPIFMGSTKGSAPARSYDQTFVGCLIILMDDSITSRFANINQYFAELNQRLVEVLRACWLNVVPGALLELLLGNSVPPPLPSGVTLPGSGASLKAWLEAIAESAVRKDLENQVQQTGMKSIKIASRLVSIAELLKTPVFRVSKEMVDYSGAIDGQIRATAEVEMTTQWKGITYLNVGGIKLAANWAGIHDGFQSTPSVAVSFTDNLKVAGRVEGSKLLIASFTNRMWEKPLSAWGPLRDAPVLIRTRYAPSVFARGEDDCLLWIHPADATYLQVRQAGVLTSPVAGINIGTDNQFCLVARGTNGVAQVMMGDFLTKLSWTSIGGDGAGRLSIVSCEPGRYDVFGRSKRNTLLRWYYVNGRWSAPEDWGGAFVSDPTAVSYEKGRLDIFAIDAQGKLIQYWYDGRPDFRLHPIGELTGHPMAISSEARSIHVVGRRTDGKVQLVMLPKFQTQAKWYYSDLGGSTRFDPAITSLNPSHFQILAVDDSGMLMSWIVSWKINSDASQSGVI